jgi:hypothetical protein
MLTGATPVLLTGDNPRAAAEQLLLRSHRLGVRQAGFNITEANIGNHSIHRSVP